MSLPGAFEGGLAKPGQPGPEALSAEVSTSSYLAIFKEVAKVHHFVEKQDANPRTFKNVAPETDLSLQSTK